MLTLGTTVPSFHLSEKKKYLFLIGLGILSVAILFLSVHNGIDYHLIKSFMGGRVQWLNGFLTEVFNGMPPSLDTIEDHDLSYYLYLSYLGKFLGIRDAEQLFLVVQMLAWGTVLLLYPAIWYYLTKTWVVGLLTPIATVMILRPMLWTYCNDSYWSMAWTVLMGIPLIAAYEKDCGKNRSFFSGGVICLVIALGNVPRGHSSMGIALVFLAVLIKSFMARYRDIRKISVRVFLSILIILFFYRCFTNVVPDMYTYFRDDYGKMENMPAWHTLYVGLGWDENKYGITWNDACGTEAAQKIDPDVIPNSKEYHEIIKQIYLSLIKEDPLYILKSYIRKLIACIKVNINYIWKSPYFLHKGTAVLLTGILLLLNKFVLKRQSQFKAYYILIFGAFFCGIQSLIFPMIATIADQYLTGSFAAGDLLLFILFVIGTSNFCNAIQERKQTKRKKVP